MGDRQGIATRREHSPAGGGSPDLGVSGFPTRPLGRFGPRLSSCWRNDCLPAETPRERFARPSPLALRLGPGPLLSASHATNRLSVGGQFSARHGERNTIQEDCTKK
jgi:hypothetical protein